MFKKWNFVVKYFHNIMQNRISYWNYLNANFNFMFSVTALYSTMFYYFKSNMVMQIL